MLYICWYNFHPLSILSSQSCQVPVVKALKSIRVCFIYKRQKNMNMTGPLQLLIIKKNLLLYPCIHRLCCFPTYYFTGKCNDHPFKINLGFYIISLHVVLHHILILINSSLVNWLVLYNANSDRIFMYIWQTSELQNT